MKSAILLFLCATAVWADDGMWLFNQFPTDAVKQKYEFDVTPAFLDHLRLSTVNLPGGVGAFVSANGLVLTNWHVVADCVPHVESGASFYAANASAEVRCAGMDAKVLLSMEDVTAKVKAGIPDDAPLADALAKRNAAIAAIETACSKTGKVCNVVNLYAGGRYDLYQYKRYDDLRLVFAPELQLAFFGRERDSITYLRYGLDAAFLRVYENGKPAATPAFLKWSTAAVKDADLVFASGSPLATARSTTVAQLNYYRDTALPLVLSRVGSRIKPISKFSAESEANKKLAEPVLKDLLANYKATIGKIIGLKDERLQIRKTLFEQKIRNAVERDPKLGTEGAKVWDTVATAYKTWAHHERTYEILDGSPAPGSTLFRIARKLVEGQDLGADADVPVNVGLETTMLTLYLDEVRGLPEKYAPIKTIMHGGKAPEDVAAGIMKSTKLEDPAVRRRYAADRSSIAKSDDGLLKLALQLEPSAKFQRNRRQEEIGTLEVSAAEKIAGYRLKLFGAADYPDATGTPRATFGTLKGYTDRAGTPQPYASTFSGLFYRRNNTTPEGPHVVPQNWIDLKDSLNVITPLDFVSTCDIGGGGYGGPTVNKAGELVGIIFDGNLESLPATYLYTDEQARAVHVAAQGIIESLDKVYKTPALIQELGIKLKSPKPGDKPSS